MGPRLQPGHRYTGVGQLLQVGNRVDFDAHISRQSRDLHGGASGIGLREILRVDLVDGREVVHVGEEDGRSDDVREGRAARLEQRAQDTTDVVAKRMARASDEMSHWAEYDYVLVNVDINDSLANVRAILQAERLRRQRQVGLNEFVVRLRGEI